MSDLLLQVAIQVEQGEMVAIMGPNGAGKTSLLRRAVRLVANSIRVDIA